MGLLLSGLTRSSKFNKSQKRKSSFTTYITLNHPETENPGAGHQRQQPRVKTHDARPRAWTRDSWALQRRGKGQAEAPSHLALTAHHTSGWPPCSLGSDLLAIPNPHSHMHWKQMLTVNICENAKTKKKVNETQMENTHMYTHAHGHTGSSLQSSKPETLGTNLISQWSYMAGASQCTHTLKTQYETVLRLYVQIFWNTNTFSI